jgi:hypothetical protein
MFLRATPTPSPCPLPRSGGEATRNKNKAEHLLSARHRHRLAVTNFQVSCQEIPLTVADMATL